MKQDQTSLQELLSSLQNLQSTQVEETGKLRRRLDWLETRRREFFNIVSQSGSDFESRRKLEETEQQLEEIHTLLTRADQELKEELREVRSRILELRNEELAKLEQEAKAVRQRRDEIHNVLLPEAQSRVSTLAEEEARLQQRNEELSRRIRELTKLDLPSSQVA